MSRELGLRSALVVPLSARGKTLGALTLVSAESARVYTHNDLALMEEIGGRIGMAIDNSRLYREAQEAIRLRDEFLSIASHELRTPLTSLQLQVTGVLRNVKSPTILHPEKLAGRVEVIDRQVDRMTTLVNGLLDVSRAAAGRLQLELAEADLTEVLRDTVDRMKEDLAAARCPLELVTNGPIVAQWDRMRLEQVFTNFIANAMKYGAGKPIEVVAGLRDGKAVVSVRDHGIGVARDDQERIFERFGRAVSADHYGGLGLGLWIVKELVDSMGGAITLDSDAGKGATFTVTLPCVH